MNPHLLSNSYKKTHSVLIYKKSDDEIVAASSFHFFWKRFSGSSWSFKCSRINLRFELFLIYLQMHFLAKICVENPIWIRTLIFFPKFVSLAKNCNSEMKKNKNLLHVLETIARKSLFHFRTIHFRTSWLHQESVCEYIFVFSHKLKIRIFVWHIK